MIALYATIWSSLIGLLVNEFGRQRQRRTLVSLNWALACSAFGAASGIIHSLVAFGSVYDWDHARAVAVTAERAAALYGLYWAGGLYINYVFLGWWAIDTAWWWLAPGTFLRRPAAVEWLWRVLVFTMVLNGAVIFASPAGRIAGVPLTVGLLWIWFAGYGAMRTKPRHIVDASIHSSTR